ncbi:MAG: DNA polymerase I [Bacteroidales bacterium]|nr:DNA polymerase I [Bacteroidales bacterium]
MKLFLIDGHALIFKMYYAFLGRPMVNSKGEDTSILFGFTKYLLELIEREKPTHIAVAFDPPGGTFRNQLYPEYKANRAETPQLVIDALEPLSEIVKSMGIPVLMVKGFEADDVIGSMAKRSVAEGFEVYMVTPDKDYGQLIEPGIFQYKPGKGGSDKEVYGVPEICEKYNITSPLQIIDILTLCGDSSDNVPGVQGVGPVGAAKFLAKYGTVENIYAHLSELTPKQQEMFKAAMDHLPLSKKLVTIKTDIPLMVSADQMRLKAEASPEVSNWLDRYEMPSLKRHVRNIWGEISPLASLGRNDNAINGRNDNAELFGEFQADPDQPSAPSEVEYSEVAHPEIKAAIRALGKCAVVVSNGKVTLATAELAATAGPAEFKDILTDPHIVKCGFALKSQINELAAAGIELQGHILDSELIHYLLNPERSHQLEMLAEHYLGVKLEGQGEAEPALGSLFDSEGEAVSEKPNSREAVIIFQLAEKLRGELGEGKGAELYEKIEEPLIKVLARMEQIGVRIDPESLRDFADGLRKTVMEKEAEVRTLAGEPTLNVSSPKQIGEVLFEKLRLDPGAKKPAKGSWPTDEETLLKYREVSPIIDAILDYRGIKKLLSTYIEPLPGYISPKDGRVHTTFNQALTSTGRLSSSNPNLQNIPVRTEQGREIRKAFTAPKGCVIMSADYSQIELRLMAHLCGDAHMIQAFREGQDVHAAMAAKIFRKPLAEVTPDDRRVAKTANFGIMYGISSFGLAQRLHCPRKMAAQIIDDYFASFPTIRSFIDGTLETARRTGYVETIFGRRRYVPDVNSHNGNIRAMAERNAVNAPIQGSAADIIKLAMIGVDRALRDQGLRSRMVLQIHDELVLEVPEDEIQPVKRILTEQMEGVMSLSVPLTVECNYGKNWLEAH